MRHVINFFIVLVWPLVLMWILFIISHETSITKFEGTILKGRVKVLKQIPFKVKLIDEKIKSTVCRSYGHEIDIETHFFNENGQLVESKIVPTPTKSTYPGSTKFEYHSNGKLKLRKYYNHKGELGLIQKLEYSKKGKLVIERSDRGYQKFKYDTDDNLIFSCNYNNDFGIEFSNYYHYKNGFLVLEDTYYHLAGWHLYKFYGRNKSGDLTKFRLGGLGENVMKKTWHRFKYEFDRKGNWIKRLRYRFGKPYYLVIREIEYY